MRRIDVNQKNPIDSSSPLLPIIEEGLGFKSKTLADSNQQNSKSSSVLLSRKESLVKSDVNTAEFNPIKSQTQVHNSMNPYVESQ